MPNMQTRRRLLAGLLPNQRDPIVQDGVIDVADRRARAVAVGVLREGGGQDLDGNFPREPRIPCFPDLAHSARAERRHDLVGTQPAAGRDCHSSIT